MKVSPAIAPRRRRAHQASRLYIGHQATSCTTRGSNLVPVTYRDTQFQFVGVTPPYFGDVYPFCPDSPRFDDDRSATREYDYTSRSLPTRSAVDK